MQQVLFCTHPTLLELDSREFKDHLTKELSPSSPARQGKRTSVEHRVGSKVFALRLRLAPEASPDVPDDVSAFAERYYDTLEGDLIKANEWLKYSTLDNLFTFRYDVAKDGSSFSEVKFKRWEETIDFLRNNGACSDVDWTTLKEIGFLQTYRFHYRSEKPYQIDCCKIGDAAWICFLRIKIVLDPVPSRAHLDELTEGRRANVLEPPPRVWQVTTLSIG